MKNMPTAAEITKAAEVIRAANSAGFDALQNIIQNALDGCQIVIDAATVGGDGDSPAAVSDATRLQKDLGMWLSALRAKQPGFVPGQDIVVPAVG